MKKTILATLALLVTTVCIAQFKFGVKAGMNYSSIKVKYRYSFDHLKDFYAGGLARLQLSEDVSLQAELVYSRQGFKGSVDTGGSVYLQKLAYYKERLNYLNVPVLAQYFAESGFHFYTGPQFGFLLNATTTKPYTPSDKTYYYKKVDVALVVGAGHLTRIGLGVDARVNFSLQNMAAAKDVNMWQTVWQVGVFYQFKDH